MWFVLIIHKKSIRDERTFWKFSLIENKVKAQNNQVFEAPVGWFWRNGYSVDG